MQRATYVWVLGGALALAACATSTRPFEDPAADPAGTSSSGGSSGTTSSGGSSGASSGATSSGGSSGASSGGSSGASSSSGSSGASSSGGSSSGGPGPRVTCGATACRSDQTCVANACTFNCVGSNVPGDYATVQAAVNALAAAGNDATICVKELSNTETVTISDSANHNKKLTIRGISSGRTSIGTVTVTTGFSEVELEGFAVKSGLTVQGAPKATLRAMRIAHTSGNALYLRQNSGNVANTIAVDGCEITNSSVSGYDVQVYAAYTAPFTVNVTNTWIHGGSYGVYFNGSGAQGALNLTNNTIDGARYGLYLSGSATASTTYVNNIISNSTNFGVNIAAGLSPTHANNALFGNVNNYAGTAVDGNGYVKADCMLDVAAGAPEPKVGSPCRGAADAAKAPASDFWNSPRGGTADIGAIDGL